MIIQSCSSNTCKSSVNGPTTAINSFLNQLEVNIYNYINILQNINFLMDLIQK
ncbi:MAG: hypothetical protein IIT97_03825 [Mycoplasmataceae bacterium]|nr:hypothetical protein [Mycoplasmataceae bacterium]MBQ5544036.1 hypothetical protein [Mycoplasmataceae bacterium]